MLTKFDLSSFRMEIKTFLYISAKVSIKTSRDKTFLCCLKHPTSNYFWGFSSFFFHPSVILETILFQFLVVVAWG